MSTRSDLLRLAADIDKASAVEDPDEYTVDGKKLSQLSDAQLRSAVKQLTDYADKAQTAAKAVLALKFPASVSFKNIEALKNYTAEVIDYMEDLSFHGEGMARAVEGWYKVEV